MIFLTVSLAICVFGIFSNVCMALLLTRPHLATTTNRLLAFVTLSDALLMLSYVVYVSHFEMQDKISCPVNLLTYGWVVFQLLHSNWSVYLRAFSLWISVVMGGYRKHVLSKPTLRRQESAKWTMKLVVLAALLVLLMCVPIFLQNTIAEGPPPPENDSVCPQNSTYYSLRKPKFALWNDRFLLKAAYWTNGLLLKLLPCTLLTYYLISVVYLMYRRRVKRRKNLFKSAQSSTPSKCGRTNAAIAAGQQNSDNFTIMPTTLILVIILLTTVLCEMPNAVLSLLSGLWPRLFFRRTYVIGLGEIMDLLSVFSCTSTSILYFIMSRSLRMSFLSTFCNYSIWTPENRRRSSTVLRSISNKNEEKDFICLNANGVAV